MTLNYIIKDNEFIEKMQNEIGPMLKEHKVSSFFKSFDKTEIHYEVYRNKDEKGAVVISHGYCEFIYKLEEVIYYFFSQGYSVYCIEHRGHGYSDRKVEDLSMVYVKSFDEYVRDLYEFVSRKVRVKDGQKKVALYAHSMGGAVGALCIEEYPDLFDCAVLSSPMMQTNYYNYPSLMIRLVTYINILIGKGKNYFNGQKPFNGKSIFEKSSCLSRERYDYMFEKRLKDKNYQTYGASIAWAFASMKAIRKLQKNACKVKIPILLFQADKDNVVLPDGQIKFVKKSVNTKFAVIEDSKHEIYNAKKEVLEKYYNKIFEFLEENL